MAIIDIKNLTFRYKNKFIFDNFNLSVEKGNWVTIAGSNGAGKTTLVKINKEATNALIFNPNSIFIISLHKLLKQSYTFILFKAINPL